MTYLTGRLQRSAAEAETARAEAKTQRAMAEISKRLELALQASATGVWDWNLATAISEGKDFTFEFRMRAGDGGLRWISNRGRATYDAFGKPLRVLGTVTDITARKQAEEKLRESEARYRVLHESLRDAFVQVAMDGRILELNDRYCQMLGYSPDEVRELTYQELTPEGWHVFEEGIVRDQIIPRGYSDVYEKEYKRKDGSVIAVELRAVLGRDAAGRPDTMWALVRDITDRKASSPSVAMFDPEMRYLAVSRRFLQDYGLPEDANLIGCSHYYVFPDMPNHWRDVHARVLAGEELTADEEPFPRSDGHTDWVRWTMKPWFTDGGKIGGALVRVYRNHPRGDGGLGMDQSPSSRPCRQGR